MFQLNKIVVLLLLASANFSAANDSTVDATPEFATTEPTETPAVPTILPDVITSKSPQTPASGETTGQQETDQTGISIAIHTTEISFNESTESVSFTTNENFSTTSKPNIPDTSSDDDVNLALILGLSLGIGIPVIVIIIVVLVYFLVIRKGSTKVKPSDVENKKTNETDQNDIPMKSNPGKGDPNAKESTEF